MRQSLFAALLAISSISFSQTVSSAGFDTTNGSVIFAFWGGGCGLTEHDAPQGWYSRIDIREFYRWNVACQSTASGYAATGWPATGRIDSNKYIAFQMIPEPGSAVHIPVNGMSFKARRPSGGPDSMEVIISGGFQRTRSLFKTRLIADSLVTVFGPSVPMTIDAPTLIRIHAWQSDSLTGGMSVGSLFVDDVAMSFKVISPNLTTVKDDRATPRQMDVVSAYPNPFNPRVTIEYRLEGASWAKMSVVDLLGRELAVLSEGSHSGGTHRTYWDADRRASGAYLCRLETPEGVTYRRLLLLR